MYVHGQGGSANKEASASEKMHPPHLPNVRVYYLHMITAPGMCNGISSLCCTKSTHTHVRTFQMPVPENEQSWNVYTYSIPNPFLAFSFGSSHARGLSARPIKREREREFFSAVVISAEVLVRLPPPPKAFKWTLRKRKRTNEQSTFVLQNARAFDARHERGEICTHASRRQHLHVCMALYLDCSSKVLSWLLGISVTER